MKGASSNSGEEVYFDLTPVLGKLDLLAKIPPPFLEHVAQTKPEGKFSPSFPFHGTRIGTGRLQFFNS
jgi:hypothetical protein